jgi:hypothetical protein
MNSLFRCHFIEQLDQLELQKTLLTFLIVLELRTVTPPYIGGNGSISKNVEFNKTRTGI